MEGLVEEPSYVGLEEEDDFPDHHVGVHTFNLEIEIAQLFQVGYRNGKYYILFFSSILFAFHLWPTGIENSEDIFLGPSCLSLVKFGAF